MFACFDGDPPPVAAHKALTKFFATLHEQGRITCQDPQVAATAFMGAMHGHHNMRHMLGEGAIDFGEDYAERMVATFWFGMQPS
jgi:hypothetical protein